MLNSYNKQVFNNQNIQHYQQSLINIIKQLQSTNSKKEKQSIIKSNLHNNEFKLLMKFLLNDFITTGIDIKKLNKNVSDVVLNLDTIYPTSKEKSNLEFIIKHLETFNSGKDEDIKIVQEILLSIENEEFKQILSQLITKNLKLGVSAKTWNKVVDNPKDKIPVFDIMLAKKFEEHKHKIKGNFIITQKLDGNRLITIKQNGVVKSYTRKGKEYIGLNDIEKEIENLNIDNVVFDGELLSNIGDLKCNNGIDNIKIFSDTLKKARSKEENKKGLIYHIFDIIDLQDFKNGISKDNAINRKNRLSEIFNNNTNLSFLKEVKPLYIGSDLNKIDEFMEYAVKNSWEGIMVNLDKPYVCKRTDSLLKVKHMQTCDLKVIGFENGTGKYSNTLGAIICEYKDNTVKVGSGFSDNLRDEIWNNQDKWFNRVVEVQYFEESIDSKTGFKSLRFPVFKKLREDDKEVSYH